MAAALKEQEKLARRTAQDLVLTLAKRGNHPWYGQLRSDADVKRFYESMGMELQAVVEQVRDPRQFVPTVENLVGSTFTLSAPGGGSASIVNLETGQEDSLVKEYGELTFANYEQAYELSAAARERAIEASSFGDFLTAITHGLAAIEGYINHQVVAWNEAHADPAAQLVDSKQNKVSFDDKIDKWIPLMTGGKKMDKGDARWADFKILRGIRDDASIHIKKQHRGVSYKELADLINKTRTGIAGLLLHLHELFGEPAPSKIIRGVYAPDVTVVVTE